MAFRVLLLGAGHAEFGIVHVTGSVVTGSAVFRTLHGGLVGWHIHDILCDHTGGRAPRL